VSQSLVLIVDDNPENLGVVGELLLPQYMVRVANGGFRALKMARLSPQPDLVLLDVMMPGMDGFEVLRTLRDDPATADIPVILLTALDSADDEERGLLLGAADYVTKPVRPGVLLARVAQQLARRAASRRMQADLHRLDAELQRQQAKLRAAQDMTLPAVLSLLDARHPDAVHHRQRVGAHLRSLCQALRRHPRFAADLDDRQIDLLVQAASLHDIGLLAVPDQVLDKPGPLDAAERRLVQAHARAGADALEQAWPSATRSAAWLPWAREIALGHHERWDGQGYPDGLAGEDIPWPVRLLSLVDTYEALTAHRPHRPAMSHAAACALIAAERGRQFDPDVTDAFLDCNSDWPAMDLRHG
jgi:putative two-component system response regulator